MHISLTKRWCVNRTWVLIRPGQIWLFHGWTNAFKTILFSNFVLQWIELWNKQDRQEYYLAQQTCRDAFKSWNLKRELNYTSSTLKIRLHNSPRVYYVKNSNNEFSFGCYLRIFVQSSSFKCNLIWCHVFRDF